MITLCICVNDLQKLVKLSFSMIHTLWHCLSMSRIRPSHWRAHKSRVWDWREKEVIVRLGESHSNNLHFNFAMWVFLVLLNFIMNQRRRRRQCHEIQMIPTWQCWSPSFVKMLLSNNAWLSLPMQQCSWMSFYLIISVYVIPAGSKIILCSLSGLVVVFFFLNNTESESEYMSGRSSPYSSRDKDGMWLLFRWK